MLGWLAVRVPPASSKAEPVASIRVRVVDGSWVVDEAGRRATSRLSRWEAAVRVLERLNELACFTGRNTTVHSGLVADTAERSIWLPAASGSGKSTLTAQLTQDGLVYATDEAVSVDAGGSLVGWNRWLCLKGGAREVVSSLGPDRTDPIQGEDQWLIPPGRLGMVEPGPLAPCVVALPRFRRGAALDVEVLSRATAVAEIAEQTFNLRRLGDRGLDALAAAVRRAQACVRITYGDGAEASLVLRDLLAAAGGTP